MIFFAVEQKERKFEEFLLNLKQKYCILQLKQNLKKHDFDYIFNDCRFFDIFNNRVDFDFSKNRDFDVDFD